MSPSSTPPLAPEPSVAPDGLEGLLADATELAIGVARRDAGRPDGAPPPASLKPYLRFSRFPPRARAAVLSALAEDGAFRATVAEAADEGALGRASWLFLTRPDGWAEEFDALRELATQDLIDSESAREEQSARRRLDQVTEIADRLRRELDDTAAELDRATAAAERLRSERSELLARIDDLGDQRGEAVRQLKEQEALAVARLDELQALRATVIELEAARRVAGDSGTGVVPAHEGADGSDLVDEGAVPDRAALPEPPRPVAQVDTDALAVVVAAAAREAAGLAASLGAAADLLAPVSPPNVDRPEAVEAVPGTTSRAPVRRRVPQRMRSGAVEDSSEGLLQLLQVPGQVVIVDGYNVSMEGWPLLDGPGQRQSLLDGLASLDARGTAVIHAVFDGVGTGGRPSRRPGSPVRVHFTDAGTEADDQILSMVERLGAATPVTVISSDRRVADGARSMGANTVRSSSLLSLLRS